MGEGYYSLPFPSFLLSLLWLAIIQQLQVGRTGDVMQAILGTRGHRVPHKKWQFTIITFLWQFTMITFFFAVSEICYLCNVVIPCGDYNTYNMKHSVEPKDLASNPSLVDVPFTLQDAPTNRRQQIETENSNRADAKIDRF
jgi:hypothetical protein